MHRTHPPRPPAGRSRTRGALVLALALPVALAATGCGGDDTDGATGPGVAATATGDGATRAGPPGTDAPPVEPPPDCALEAGCEGLVGGNWTSIPGYDGPLAESPGPVAAVDEATVRAVTDGPWEAAGLVVNGAGPVVGPVEVEAVLVAADGSELGRARSAALVSPLRAGEASPFRLASDVPAEQVARVAFGVDAPGAAAPGTELGQADAARRALRLAVYWTRPYGGDEAVAVPGWDEPRGYRPHLVYGEASVEGDAVVESPVAVAAWLDDDGRVLAVTEAPLRRAGTDAPVDALEPGVPADLVLTFDDPTVARQLEGRNPILWGMSR
jgi:hypothetical protein